MSQKAGSPSQYNFPQRPSDAGVERIRTPFWLRTRCISPSACISVPVGRCSSTSENIATENVLARKGRNSTLPLMFGWPLISTFTSPNRVSLQPMFIEKPGDACASRLTSSISPRRDKRFFFDVALDLVMSRSVINFLNQWFARTTLQRYPMNVVSPTQWRAVIGR